jgi:hypothetical protein
MFRLPLFSLVQDPRGMSAVRICKSQAYSPPRQIHRIRPKNRFEAKKEMARGADMGAMPQAGLASGAALHLEIYPHILHPEIFCSGELGFGS